MGGTTSCCACGTQDEEQSITAMTAESKEDSMATKSEMVVQSASGSSIKANPTLQALQGRWTRQGDAVTMGEVRGDKMHWSEDLWAGSKPGDLEMAPSGSVLMSLETEGRRESFSGQLAPGNAELRWSDGEA
ncbi:unnamed protein product, partial [Prorocentrum cordatum]